MVLFWHFFTLYMWTEMGKIFLFLRTAPIEETKLKKLGEYAEVMVVL